MTPLHTDTRRFSFFDPLLLIVAGFMVFQGFTGGGEIPILTGIAVAGFLAFTKHQRYDLYPDALVINYWAPRKIVIPLSEIRDVGSVRLPFGGPSLLLHRTGGRVLPIMPKDTEAFLTHLKASMETARQQPSPAAARQQPSPAAARQQPSRAAEPPKPRTPRRRPRRQRNS